jgi:catechol 2,3-dioxygenase-like lactoylglutathione lyase family enzyme
MERSIGQISIVIRDYDEALNYYINVLGFELVEDTVLTPEKRWVVIKPKNSSGQGCNLLLARAANPNQENFIGNQTGGRVFLFLYTDDIQRDHEMLLKNNVKIVRPPSSEEYGTVLVFSDIYGNLWDLIERK